jgi:hypothetical protein
MAPRPRFLVAVAGGLVVAASLTACAHGSGATRTASPSSRPSTTTTAPDAPAGLVVSPPTPTRLEPKALSPLPTVSAR